jgi:Glycosyl transferases group 1
MRPVTPALVLCSNSSWIPAIRRDHALALEASSHGHPVTFLERPDDVRALRHDRRASWLTGLVRPRGRQVAPGLMLRPRSTIVPGHRGAAAEVLDGLSLGRALRAAVKGRESVVVATTPWQWPAVSRLRGVRRVFDAADDWSRLNAARADRFGSLYERVAREADEIVVVSEALRELFPGRDPVVVRNAVGPELLEPPPAAPEQARLVYAGTLSERFDAGLVGAVLERLPDWRLDLYGECQYPGRGQQPGPELERLLDRFDGRVAWHGVVGREGLARVLDEAAVLVIPNRSEYSQGQDSMKAYDYASRGRPIVTTSWSDALDEIGPPHLYRADGAEQFASQILAAAAEPDEHAEARRAWARGQTWSARWPVWSKAIFGA